MISESMGADWTHGDSAGLNDHRQPDIRARENMMIRRGVSVLVQGFVTLALVVGLICVLWTPLWAGGKNSQERELHHGRLERFSTELENLSQLLKIPGLSAAIVRDQNVIWAKGLGFASLENQIPATPHTPYRIASLTKPFAATLLMQLVERGQLDLDEPMATYSGYFKDETVKVRHVLTHTSGGIPGDQFRYQGGRFASLIGVIETASGRRFHELMITNILDQLDMASSVPGQAILTDVDNGSADLDQEAFNRYKGVVDRMAQPYTLYDSNEMILVPLPPWRLRASSGLISTVMDLAKFDAALDHHILLKRSTQARVFTPAVANDGRSLPYGLGWFVQHHRRVKLMWHYGDWRHFSALILKIPSISTTLILLANSDALSAPFGLNTGDVMRSPFACTFFRLFVVEDAVGRTLPTPRWSQTAAGFAAERSVVKDHQDGYGYECEATAHTAVMRWLTRKRASARTAIQVDPTLYHAYIGQYAFNPRVTLTVFQQGNRYYIHPTGQPTFEIFPQSKETFFAKSFEALFTFVNTDSDQMTHMILHGGSEQSAKRKLNRLRDDFRAGLDV